MPPLLIASPLAPLVLTAPAPSAHGRAAQDQVPRSDEWWKWPTPRKIDSLEGAKEWSPRTSKTQKTPRTETRLIGSWRVGEALGEGSSGKVRVVRHTETGEWAAMKRIPKPPRDSKHWSVIEREIILLKISEHPRVIRLLDVFETPTHLYLLSELCPYGELYQEIMHRKPGKSTVRRWFGQLVAALSHLHVLSIAHRDIKPENLLLVRDRNGSMGIKLADLGMATWQKPGTFLETSCGSPHYASPAAIMGIEYDGLASDVWSTGVVLFALVAGRLPFDDDHIPTMMKKIKIGTFSIPASVDSAAKDLIRKMVVVKPESRLSIFEVARHPYLQGVHIDEVDSFTRLPYPLATDHRQAQPPNLEEIEQEKHLVSNLKILLRTTSDQRVVDAVLKEDGPQLFWVILRNFRSRCAADDSNSERRDSDDIKQHPGRERGRAPSCSSRPLSLTSEARSHSLPPPSPSAVSPPPPTPLPDLPSGASSSPLPARAYSNQPIDSLKPSSQPMDTPAIIAFPPLEPLAPRRQSSAPEPDPRTRTALLEPTDAEEKPRAKTFSIVKLKERFFGPGQSRPSSSTSSPTKAQFAVLRDAPPPPSGLSIPPTLSTPNSPASPNPRTVKRSNGYASLAKAAIGLGPNSPSPDHSPTSNESPSSHHVKRKKSSLSSMAMVRRSWLETTRDRGANENENVKAATAPPEPSPSKRRRPTALTLVSNNRLPVSDPRSPLADPTAKAHHQQSLSPRPSEDPFSHISVIQPTTPSFLQPRSAPLPPPLNQQAGSLRGPANVHHRTQQQQQPQLQQHKTSGSVVLKLEADNQLLRAALALKDDEIVSLRSSERRLSQRVERQAARCEELEEEKDDLAERIARMSFETSESIDRRWNSLLRDTEEGRSAEDAVAPVA